MRSGVMKLKCVTHSLLVATITSALVASPLFAENSEIPADASTAVEKPVLDTDLKYESRTVYEHEFLPGVRFCEDEEVDYRGDFRKVNCQDEDKIRAVSTRDEDLYNANAHSIVDDRIEPNGNLLRINFRKKVVPVQ